MDFKRLLSLFALTLLLCGCTDNPGAWPREKVEAYVKESIIEQGSKLTEISLSPAGESAFSGTGLDEQGEKFKIDVTQEPAASKLSWKATGDRGTFLEGSMTMK